MSKKNHIKTISIEILFLLLAVSAIFTYLTLSHATGFSDVPQGLTPRLTKPAPTA